MIYNPVIYKNIIAILYEKVHHIREHDNQNLSYYWWNRDNAYWTGIQAIMKTNFYFKHVRLG